MKQFDRFLLCICTFPPVKLIKGFSVALEGELACLANCKLQFEGFSQINGRIVSAVKVLF